MDPSAAVIVNTALSASKLLLDAAGEWNSIMRPKWIEIQRLRGLADRNSALGYNKNLKRNRYTTTPILQKLDGSDSAGKVAVVYVPPSRGKTTAAFTYLAANRKYVRGLAFCISNTTAAYYQEMLQLLGYNPSKPPTGWLSCLIEALNETNDPRKTFLILDEYEGIPNDANDGFLRLLKTHIRNTRIHVVVMCPSKAYATHTLSLNYLAGIVPLKGTYRKSDYPHGEWQSMEWNLDTIKSAARCIPEFRNHADEIINSEVDAFATNFNLDQEGDIDPMDVFTHLRTALTPTPAQSQDNALASFFSIDDEENSCQSCHIAWAP